MDLRKILEFTSDRLHFLSSQADSEASQNGDFDAGALGLDLRSGGYDFGEEQAMGGEEQQLRYSQGPGDDFKQILDSNNNEMMRDGIFLGQEPNQSCLEFLGPRR